LLSAGGRETQRSSELGSWRLRCGICSLYSKTRTGRFRLVGCLERWRVAMETPV